MRVLVVGGGIFGCCIAIELARDGHKVQLVEKKYDLMLGASKCNANRLHTGAHYPRSTVTAKQSLEGLVSFFMEFGPAVTTAFPNYYVIAKDGSLTSPEDFRRFCDEVGISYREQWPQDGVLDRTKADACFLIPEPIFCYDKLKQIVQCQLKKTGVSVALNWSMPPVKNIWQQFDFVVNATYSAINEVNMQFGVKPLNLHYEETVMLVYRCQIPPIGITVLDGDFATVMPHGDKEGEFLLYHVLHSVNPRAPTETIRSEAAKYMPFLSRAQLRDAYYARRAVVESKSDARLTEIHRYPELPNYISVLSGKISTCVRTAIQVRHLVRGNTNNYLV